jgi:hypothetical protein
VTSFLNERTCAFVQQEDMSSYSTRSHVFLSNSTHVFLLKDNTSRVAEREHMSACRARSHVLLFTVSYSQSVVLLGCLFIIWFQFCLCL